MLIGIIGAMARETDAVIARISSPETDTVCGIRYCKGTLEGVPVVAAQCGIGKVFAALCAALMIEHWHPDLILNIGVAGALTDGLDIADIVIADSAVEHDMDTTPIGDPPGLISGPGIVHIPCDADLSALLRRSAEEAGLRWEEGAVATGDQFIASEEYVKILQNDFHAIACEMEGAAIAVVCSEYEMPFVVIRAMSDKADGLAHESYENMADKAADNSSRIIMQMLESI